MTRIKRERESGTKMATDDDRSMFPFKTVAIRHLSARQRGLGSHHPVSPGLVIHFHGGGFVSGSSATHEVYLRSWCIHLDCPIVSVDYRLAPEHAYPTAIDECFFAYCWCLANCEKLGSSAQNVVICGDSAGGNLAAAVTLRCLMEVTFHYTQRLLGPMLGSTYQFSVPFVLVECSPSR
jgi:acetyl esterase/lipase